MVWPCKSGVDWIGAYLLHSLLGAGGVAGHVLLAAAALWWGGVCETSKGLPCGSRHNSALPNLLLWLVARLLEQLLGLALLSHFAQILAVRLFGDVEGRSGGEDEESELEGRSKVLLCSTHLVPDLGLEGDLVVVKKKLQVGSMEKHRGRRGEVMCEGEPCGHSISNLGRVFVAEVGDSVLVRGGSP